MTEAKAHSLNPELIPEELLKFRQTIDGIDSEIIALIKKRCEIVKQVGEFKKKKGHKGCFIRPGREADMLRAIFNEFSRSPFSPIAAAQIWRIIISASTRIESDLRISTFAPEKDPSLFWVAREYFGTFSSVTRHPNCNRVVGDVVDGKTEVGILPAISVEEEGRWWLTLAQQEESTAPQIFAHIPFVTQAQSVTRPSGLAIAKIAAEPTGDDVTFIAVETQDLSIHRLTTTFTTSGMKATRIAHEPQGRPGQDFHLLQIAAFIAADDMRLQGVRNKLGDNLLRLRVLGSFATPILTNDIC